MVKKMSVIRFENSSYFVDSSYSKIINLMNVILGNISIENKKSSESDSDNYQQTILNRQNAPQGLFNFSLEDHQQVSFTYLAIQENTNPNPILFQPSDEELSKTIIIWDKSLIGLALFKSLSEILGGEVYVDDKLVYSVPNIQSKPQNEFLYQLCHELDYNYHPDVKFLELYKVGLEIHEDDLSSSFFKKIINNCMDIAAASAVPLSNKDLLWSQGQLPSYRVKKWEAPLVSPSLSSPSIKNNFKMG